MSAPAPAADVPSSAGGAAAVARLRAAGKEMRATLAQTAMSAWADDTDELAKKGRGAAAASGTDGADPDLPDASLDTEPGGRPPASSHFWLETVQVSGALLMHSRTSELQKEHLLESLRLWNAHRLPDAADSDADTGASAPPVGAIKKGLRERTEKLGTLHTEMITRAREESRTATRKAQEIAGGAPPAGRKAKRAAELPALPAGPPSPGAWSAGDRSAGDDASPPRVWPSAGVGTERPSAAETARRMAKLRAGAGGGSDDKAAHKPNMFRAASYAALATTSRLT